MNKIHANKKQNIIIHSFIHSFKSIKQPQLLHMAGLNSVGQMTVRTGAAGSQTIRGWFSRYKGSQRVPFSASLEVLNIKYCFTDHSLLQQEEKEGLDVGDQEKSRFKPEVLEGNIDNRSIISITLTYILLGECRKSSKFFLNILYFDLNIE